jgi:hypothetical protein
MALESYEGFHKIGVPPNHPFIASPFLAQEAPYFEDVPKRCVFRVLQHWAYQLAMAMGQRHGILGKPEIDSNRLDLGDLGT